MLQNNSLNLALNKIGLNQLEVDVYLYLLNSPNFKVAAIADQFNTNRVQVYRILNRLAEFKLVSKTKDPKIKYYLANPKQIMTLVREQQLAFHNLADHLKPVLHDLSSKFSFTNHKSIVQVLSGQYEFTKFIVQAIDVKLDWIYIYGGNDFFELTDEDIWVKWLENSIKNGTKIKIITSMANKTLRASEFLNKPNIDVKFMPIEYKFVGSISISKELTIIWDTINPRVINLQGVSISQIHQSWFEMLWSLSATD
jgi:sugar-specific transcriptional regulator TrmB